MDQERDDKQADRPVRSSGDVLAHPCDRCARTTGSDGYWLPRTTVTSTLHDNAYLVLCAQCLRDALTNLETEQRRRLENAPPLTPSPVPVPLPERTNPGVGGVETGTPAKRGRR